MAEAPFAIVELVATKGTFAAQFTGERRKKIHRAFPIAKGQKMPKSGEDCKAFLDSKDQQALSSHAARLNSGGFLSATVYR